MVFCQLFITVDGSPRSDESHRQYARGDYYISKKTLTM